jgi:hypothetical protein
MNNRTSHFKRIALLSILVGAVSACGGDPGLPPLSVELFNFAPGFGGVHLNSPLELSFSSPVDPASVNPDSIRIFTTTSSGDAEPGARAVGEFFTSGNIVTFEPRIPQRGDLSDSGLQMGFTYTIQVPAAPDIISPVRTVEGDPNMVEYVEFFSTLNSTILPAPLDILSEPNLTRLHLFFIDEGIQNGTDPCPRASPTNPSGANPKSPQVVETDPEEGETGYGTITGIVPGLGTAFVRLDPISLRFSEPISPWRIRAEDIKIQNVNLGGETFDLNFFFRQDRAESRLQITVFDKDSAFDQASVPQGTYVLQLTNFSDLAGNPLINRACIDDGSFNLTFSTVASPSQATDVIYTFDDNDGEGHVDVGGLPTSTNDPNLFPTFQRPYLGGVWVEQNGLNDQIPFVAVSTNANWGDVAYWTGFEVRYDNGYRPSDPALDPIPSVLRLRGGTRGAATPVFAPIGGRALGRSSSDGSLDGSVPVNDPGGPEEGKVDFYLEGMNSAFLFTGDIDTGPIVYHYRRFDLLETGGSGNVQRPLLTVDPDSIYPLIIFVEEDAKITGDILLDGEDGEFGFDGANDGSTSGVGRNPGGDGGIGVAGGGDGGPGGAYELGADATLLNGREGEVPVNVLGPVTSLSKAIAGLTGMATGGGGQWDASQIDAGNPNSRDPAHAGGGGGGPLTAGGNGADLTPTLPPGGASEQGRGGNQYGTGEDFTDADTLALGGAGGGGGAAEDDSSTPGEDVPDGVASDKDNGGGGGGAGGGYLALTCAGTMTLGERIVSNVADPTTDQLRWARIRCVGGRGGSTYEEIHGSNPPLPGPDTGGDPDITSDVGFGEAGGGGAGGGIVLIAGDQIKGSVDVQDPGLTPQQIADLIEQLGELIVGEFYALGKAGGNSGNPLLEGRDDSVVAQGGDGGVGLIWFADSDDFTDEERSYQSPAGENRTFLIAPDELRDVDPEDGEPDLDETDDAAILLDLREMTGTGFVSFAVKYETYGDDTREILYGPTRIVSHFFDTLSQNVTYNQVRVLSNADLYHYVLGSDDLQPAAEATMRFFVDTTTDRAGDPDLSDEGPDGSMGGNVGNTIEAILHYDGADPFNPALPQSDAIYSRQDPIPPASVPALRSLALNRFVRLRIIYDMSNDGTPEQLFNTFDPIGGSPEQIAPDNGLGNIDTAPQGVPAVAEVRVVFTP